MLSLSMVVIAALIGAERSGQTGGAGAQLRRTSRLGEAGSIVVLAIMLDRMSRVHAGGKNERRGRIQKRRHRLRRSRAKRWR
jgi:ABC-type proline/glycine betaine transport system permease subunit